MVKRLAPEYRLNDRVIPLSLPLLMVRALAGDSTMTREKPVFLADIKNGF